MPSMLCHGCVRSAFFVEGVVQIVSTGPLGRRGGEAHSANHHRTERTGPSVALIELVKATTSLASLLFPTTCSERRRTASAEQQTFAIFGYRETEDFRGRDRVLDLPFDCAFRKSAFVGGSLTKAQFDQGDAVRILPCGHLMHSACVDPWLLKTKRMASPFTC